MHSCAYSCAPYLTYLNNIENKKIFLFQLPFQNYQVPQVNRTIPPRLRRKTMLDKRS